MQLRAAYLRRPLPTSTREIFDVNTVAVVENAVFCGRNFTTIGGVPRSNLAALDVTTGQAMPWTSNTNRMVIALAVSGNVVYAGGEFTTINNQNRNYLAALDAVSGQVMS